MKTLNDIMPTLENFLSEKRATESELTEKRAAIGREMLALPEIKQALVDLENAYEEKGNYSLDEYGLKFSVALPNIFPRTMEKSARKEALECLALAISDDGPYYVDREQGEIYVYMGPCITVNWHGGRNTIFCYDHDSGKTILDSIPREVHASQVSVEQYVAAVIAQYQNKIGCFNYIVQTDYYGGFSSLYDIWSPLKDCGVNDLDDAAGIQSVIDAWNETSEEN